MAKVSDKLTPITIKAKAKPGATPFKLTDGKGLYLLVNPNGACYWRMAYRFAGLQKLLALGVHPELSLAGARDAAQKARDSLKNGIDPNATRKELKEAKVAKVAEAIAEAVAETIEATRNARTFQVVAEEWLAKQASKRSDSTMQKARWMLTAFAFPSIGAHPIDAIKASDLLACLRTLEARGVLETASRLQQRMNAICRYAVACDYMTHNPAVNLKDTLDTRDAIPRAAITKPEKIGELLRAIEGFDGYMATGYALRLSALTFVRPGEIRGALWSEFDFTANVWRIDAKRMKMKAGHDVPLSRQALELLNELKPLSGSGRLLFPGVRANDRPISENTLNAALRTLGFSGDVMTAHGFRAMASTRLNEMLQFKPDAIERALAHKEPNKVRASYDRSEHWAERVKMMQVWADYLDTLRTGGNVIAGKFGRVA
jgi:integrase